MDSELERLGGLFDADRATIARLLGDVDHLARHGSGASACKVFAEVRRLVEHHLVAEQQAAGALEREGQFPPALATRLARSRERLQGAVEGLWQAISGSDGPGHERALEELRRALDAHWEGDRGLLFPALCARYPRVSDLDRVVHEVVDP